jgi:hypothetical protein
MPEERESGRGEGGGRSMRKGERDRESVREMDGGGGARERGSRMGEKAGQKGG